MWWPTFSEESPPSHHLSAMQQQREVEHNRRREIQSQAAVLTFCENIKCNMRDSKYGSLFLFFSIWDFMFVLNIKNVKSLFLGKKKKHTQRSLAAHLCFLPIFLFTFYYQRSFLGRAHHHDHHADYSEQCHLTESPEIFA